MGFGKVSISRAGARQGEASTILLSHQHPTPTLDIQVQTTLDFLSFWTLRTCGTANDVVQHCCRTAYLPSRKGNARRKIKVSVHFGCPRDSVVERQKFRGPDVSTFRYKRWVGTHTHSVPVLHTSTLVLVLFLLDSRYCTCLPHVAGPCPEN